METQSRRRSRRMDLRTTPEERELIDRAVAATGTDLTDFVVTHACDAARRVLADRDHFELNAAALEDWERNLEKLIVSPELRARFGANGHEHVVRRYAMSAYRGHYLALLARLAAA